MGENEAVHEKDELPPSNVAPPDPPAAKAAKAPAAAPANMAALKKSVIIYFAKLSVAAKERFKKVNKENFNEVSKKYDGLLTVAMDSELLTKSSLGKKVKTVEPWLAKGAAGVEILMPFVALYLTFLWDAYSAVLRFTPPGLLPALWGGILCFFGGEYMTLIAAVEAFELSGGYAAVQSAKVLADQAFVAIDASVASNSDALAKLETRELIAHKSMVALKALDPEKSQAAIGQLYLCWMAMLATLKIQFARTVALGLSISNTVKPFGNKYVTPVLQELVPMEFRKWVPVMIDVMVKAFVVSLAWMIQTVVSTVQSALRGGILVSTHVVAYLSSKKYMKPLPPNSVTLDIIGLGIALLGILFQVSNGWGVPFPLNLFTWPLDIVEWFLRWQISHAYGEPLSA